MIILFLCVSIITITITYKDVNLNIWYILNYLQIKIKKNINIIKKSIIKKLNKSKFINKNNKSIVNNDSDNIKIAIDNIVIMKNLLKYTTLIKIKKIEHMTNQPKFR